MEEAAMCDRTATIVFEAQDALGGQVRSADDVLAGLDFARINPATGPVYIEGSEPGDTLLVHVQSIETADRGVIVTGPGMGVLGDAVQRHATRILPIENGEVVFGDLRIPARPMIGVIGVAPAEGSYATGTAYRHGGNMDTKEIVAGCTICLPVSQSGALLALGDVHAVMGDGEVCVSACEVAARVTVGIEVLKGRQTEWPVVEAEGWIYIVVSLPTIEEATVEATRQAVKLLRVARGLSEEDAYMLASLVADIRISQLVDPNKTAKAAIPAWIVGSEVCHLL